MFESIRLTFPSDIGEKGELIVAVNDNHVTLSVYEGKSASFDKKDIKKIFNTIMHLVNDD